MSVEDNLGTTPNSLSLQEVYPSDRRHLNDSICKCDKSQANESHSNPTLYCKNTRECADIPFNRNEYLDRRLSELGADPECIAIDVTFDQDGGHAIAAGDVGDKGTSKNTNLDEAPENGEETGPDGGWGWMIVFSAFMISMILDGIVLSGGIFLVHLLHHFRSNKGTTSWISSVMNGTYLTAGPIASVLVQAFDSRRVTMAGSVLAAAAIFSSTWSPNVIVMIVVYGLLGGIGFGLMFLPPLFTVTHYFSKKRSLAVGIAVCGSGVGSFVFAPLSEFLIERYTWKGALWIISGIAFNGVVMATLLRPLRKPDRNTTSTEQNRDRASTGSTDHDRCCDLSRLFDFTLLKRPSLIVYGSSCFLNTLGLWIPITFIPDLANSFGFDPQRSALLISIFGITNTICRLLVGLITDRKWADAILINSFFLVAGGGATMFVPFYSNYLTLAAYCVFFGITFAVYITLNALIPTELFGVDGSDSSLGIVKLCQGIASFIGPPIAGAMSDVSGDYTNSFYMAGLTIAISGIMCLPLRKINRWEQEKRLRNLVADTMQEKTET